MKLIAASATLLAAINAQQLSKQQQSIEVLVTELVNKVYQVSDDGLTHTFNAFPYFQATYNCLGEGFEGEGTFGNGNGVFSFTQMADWTNGDHFNYKFVQSGKIGNHPLATFQSAEVLDYFVEEVQEFRMSASGIFYKDSGKVDGTPYTQQAELTIDEVTMTSEKIGAQIEITQSHSNFYRTVPSGSSTISVVASAKTACFKNPIDRACSAKLIITGENDGKDVGRNVVRYSVQANRAQFFVNHNKNEVFRLVLSGFYTMEVLALKYAINGGPTTLFLQFAGPAGMEAIAVAVEEFITPFVAFFSSMYNGCSWKILGCLFNNLEDAIRAVVYSDALFTAAQGQHYFNFYPVIKATQFESELLASTFKVERLGVSNLQGAFEEMCYFINMEIEAVLNEGVPMIAEARTYVHELTGATGKSQFDAWFAQI